MTSVALHVDDMATATTTGAEVAGTVHVAMNRTAATVDLAGETGTTIALMDVATATTTDPLVMIAMAAAVAAEGGIIMKVVADLHRPTLPHTPQNQLVHLVAAAGEATMTAVLMTGTLAAETPLTDQQVVVVSKHLSRALVS